MLANRLSTDPKTTVLLLEAGPPNDRREIHIPAAFPKLWNTPYDWRYMTEPSPASTIGGCTGPVGARSVGARR